MIQYRIALFDEIEVLTQVRLEFMCEVSGINNLDDKNLYANNKDYFTRAISNESFVAWVATDDNKIIATSGISFYELPPNMSCTNGKVAYISNMFTFPKYRKRGIASKLFDLSVNEAIERGCKKIMLEATNMGRPLYEKYGFMDAKNQMIYCVI